MKKTPKQTAGAVSGALRREIRRRVDEAGASTDTEINDALGGYSKFAAGKGAPEPSLPRKRRIIR